MATAKVARVKELIECSICGGRFTRPKALPCQHCFCQECLESWLASSRGDKKNITCPQCRKQHAVPKSGIVGFPDHYLMNNLLDIAGQGEERCADCSEQADIIKTCPHCQQRICADCLIAHVVIKATDQEDEGRSSSAVTSKPSAVTSKPSAVTSPSSAGPSRTLANRQTFSQNQLPRNVDYRAMRGGLVTVIRDSGEEENRLRWPEGCAYHVARREVYVADWWNDRVMVYDRDGSNGRVFYKDREFRPQDVAVSTDGQFLYIALNKSLIKTNMSGECVKTIKTFSLGALKACTSVHCYREFTLAVDRDNSCVVVFDLADKEIRCFGQAHLKLPAHLAVSEDGQVHVTDLEGSCVHVFSWEGTYLRSFGGTGEDEDISGIAVDSDSNVCVSRWRRDRIHVYDPQGEVITTIGSDGEEPGQLSGPAGLCLTPDGCLVVAECGNKRVQILGRERDDHC